MDDLAAAPVATARTDGRLIYAVGDIHGRYDLLKRLMSAIAHDIGRGEARPLLVFCGDYIDRGPQSAEVVEAVMWLQRQKGLDVRALKGNHEQGLLSYLDAPAANLGWLRFGGTETLISYGVRPPEDLYSEAECAGARDELLLRMPASHLRFLETLELMLVVGDYAFVHAGVRPGAALEEQTEKDLLWIRGEFLSWDGPLEKMVVHGHTWVDDQPQVYAHRIGLDTGAYATGVLTAVRLEGESRRFLQVSAGEAAPLQTPTAVMPAQAP